MLIALPSFSQVYSMETLDGKCNKSEIIDIDAGKARKTPYNCNAAVISYFDKEAKHLQVQLTTKQSNDVNALLGFGAIYDEKSKKYKLTTIYVGTKALKPTVVDNSRSDCSFSGNGKQTTKLYCTGATGEKSQTVIYDVEFIANQNQSSAQTSQPTSQPSQAPGFDKSGMINLQNPVTILASCGTTAKMLTYATSGATAQIISKSGSSPDASWQTQQDGQSLKFMAEQAKFWSVTLDRNYTNLVPPSQISEYVNELSKSVIRFNNIVGKNPWNGIGAWLYCVDRYQIGYR